MPQVHSLTSEQTLVREANHRIANHLAMLVTSLQFQARALAKGPAHFSRKDASRMMQETISKIINIERLHRRLADTTNDQTIDLADYLIECSVTLVAGLALTDRVHLAHRLEAHCHVRPEQAQPLSLLVNEIIMNAVRHAHPADLPVQIEFSCGHTADGGLLIEISDDGVGLPEGFNPKIDGGVGFQLIRILTQSLGASYEIDSGPLGLSFRLLIPSMGAANSNRSDAINNVVPIFAAD